MTLAEKAGIRTARTIAVRLTVGHAVAVKRFDRHGVLRVHGLSARVALRAAGEPYELSPACDILPSRQALGFQQMRVGEQEADSTLDNARSMSRMFSLTEREAIEEAQAVAKVVDGWKEHFTERGVTPADVEAYEQHIDRPFLRDQRREIGARSTRGGRA